MLSSRRRGQIRRKPSAPWGRDESQKSDLYRQDTQIMVQIENLGSKTIHIQVFKALDNLDDIFWEHQSHVYKSSPWSGIVSPKLYIKHRFLEVQSLHKLKHVSHFMVMLTTEIVERIFSSEESLAEHTLRPFLPSAETVALFKRLLPINDPQDFKIYETEKLLPLWRKNSVDTRGEAASLFIELLAISLIENTYDEEPGFYVDVKSKTMARAFIDLRKSIVDFILYSNIPHLVASIFQVHQMAVNVTGTEQLGRLTRPLISARNGQVLFLSVLETMELPREEPLRFRVFPGVLLHGGLRYSYAEAEDLTVLGDMLEVEKVTSSDFADDVTNMRIVKRLNNKWFCTTDDGFLTLYFAPDLEKDYSIWPHLFILASEILMPNDSCPTLCLPDMGTLSPEVAYCQTLAAAISDSDPRMIRVLQSIGNRGKEFLMFVLGELAHIWSQGVGGFAYRIKQNTIILILKAEKILRAEFRDEDFGMKRAVLTQ